MDPIIVNKRNNIVIGGHQRLKILTELGNKAVDVSVADLDEKEEKALNVALNKISGEWDMPMLQDILFELNTDGFDMESIGFSMEELQLLEFSEPDVPQEDAFDAEKAAEEITDPITKPGDIYFLGKHRLLCGDATKPSDVQRLMDGKAADMVFTDPPYNVDYTGGTEEHLKIQNDKMADADFYKFLLRAYENMFAAVGFGGVYLRVPRRFRRAEFSKSHGRSQALLTNCLIWVKSSLVLVMAGLPMAA